MNGGEEERILDQGGKHEWYNWALARKGIYFLKHHKGGADLSFFDFAVGKTTTVSTTERENWIGLALSADGRSILYSEIELEDSTIMLVRNFR